ncbi:MAG: hypothetical protein KBA18_09625 [Kiritimatiellae bacterium]|nr:hypothetical protein [Kiritimatiellia bacterium]
MAYGVLSDGPPTEENPQPVRRIRLAPIPVAPLTLHVNGLQRFAPLASRCSCAVKYAPPEGAEGGLRVHRSKARLDLILTQNVRRARGYARRAVDMDILDDWPAQELVRVFQRKAPRDWRVRWAQAGGRLYGGRMIALKTDPVWSNISRFGESYPPFDYGSGMGLRDIAREEAEKLGLIGPDDVLTPEEPEYPEAMAANLPGIDGMPALREAIGKAMGGGVSFDGDTLRFPTRVPAAGATGSPATLGLPGLTQTAVSRTPQAVRPEEALALIRRGSAAAVDPDGALAEADAATVAHWRRKYRPGEVRDRLATIRRAFDAVREPQETWERKGRKYYLKTTTDADGRMHHTYVVVRDGRIETWVSRNQRGTTENKRGGILLQRQGG